MQIPDASRYLVYDRAYMDPASPDGCWLCTDAEDVQAIQINAAALPLGAPEEHLARAKAFFEAFPFVLVVGADPVRRGALADALRRQVPSVEVCVTAQSAYRGCGSVRELRETHGLSAVDELWRDAEELPPYGLLEISGIEDVDILRQSRAKSGIPELDRRIGGFYDGEVSVWTGKRKEGKSTMLGLPILAAIREGRRVFVYSGELPAWRYKAWLTAMAAGPGNLEGSVTDTGRTVWSPRSEICRQIDLWWKNRIFVIDNRVSELHRPEKLLGLMGYAHRRYGCSMFVIDNLMTLSLPWEDRYLAQSAFVGRLVDFAHETNTHIHLVAHRRKGGTAKGNRGDSDDISGSGDITNRADNVLAVTRLEDADSPYSSRLEILANRGFGETGAIDLHFDPRSRRFYAQNVNWPCGWETTAEGSQLTLRELTGAEAETPFS